MIPKVSSGASFADLQRYLTENRDCEIVELRGVSSLDNAAAEMSAVAQLSQRVKSPVMHISLSVAVEDGVLPNDTWRQLFDAVDAEFDLAAHQRVLVRHRDKDYDHCHCFLCKISPATGQTPTKQWFRVPDAPLPALRDRAIPAASLASVPPELRKKYAFDRRALTRLQALARVLEKQFGFRQLRTPEEAAAARVLNGRPGPSSRIDRHHHDRTGAPKLLERATEIRAALDAPDWPTSRANLNSIGLDFAPVMRTVRGAEEYRGLVIFDLGDAANRLPASKLDDGDHKYGLRQLERRHGEHALKIDEWWPLRKKTVFGNAGSVPGQLRAEYAMLREHHRITERQKAAARRKLRAQQKRQRAAEAAALMRRRRTEALQLAPDQRRAFYSAFSRKVRSPQLEALAEAHRKKAVAFRRSRMPTWTEFCALRIRRKISSPQVAWADVDVSAPPSCVAGRTLNLARPRAAEAKGAPSAETRDATSADRLMADDDLAHAALMRRFARNRTR